MWDKPWFWDVNECWVDYPHHKVPPEVWWYYLFGAGFYSSLLLTQVFDAKRKDFWEMLVHHLVTIFLMGFSWICNLTRIGSLVLIVHDCVDILLEGAKMCKYANKTRLAEGIFGVFLGLWVITNLGFIHFTCLRSRTTEAV